MRHRIHGKPYVFCWRWSQYELWLDPRVFVVGVHLDGPPHSVHLGPVEFAWWGKPGKVEWSKEDEYYEGGA